MLYIRENKQPREADPIHSDFFFRRVGWEKKDFLQSRGHVNHLTPQEKSIKYTHLWKGWHHRPFFSGTLSFARADAWRF